jgi:hypothetical protein
MNTEPFTCSELDDHARDLVRLERSAAPEARETLARATAHLAACPRCVRRMAAERALDAALAGLARTDAMASAPPRVEAALRAQFPKRLRWQWPAAAAMAAAAVIALWAVVPARRREPPAEPVRVEELTTVETTVTNIANVAMVRSPFLPIGSLERARDTTRGHVVRMRVPATLPVMFGWPLPPEDDRPRTADVLFGEDGVARGIRFVSTGFHAGR